MFRFGLILQTRAHILSSFVIFKDISGKIVFVFLSKASAIFLEQNYSHQPDMDLVKLSKYGV